MKVLLLGAGASKSYTESPTGCRMPVAADFFSTFFDLELASNPWVLRDGLIYYLQRMRGINDPDRYLLSGIDIEAIHSELALQLAEYMSMPKSFERLVVSKAYIQLIFLFSATLNEIANGPVSQSHMDLARNLGPRDVVITFNWDILMERALRSNNSWRVDYGYGVQPYRIFRDTWEYPNTPNAETGTKILKLHGSTNWLTAHPTNEDNELVLTHGLPENSLFVFEQATVPYATHAGRFMKGYGPLTYGYYPPNLQDVPGRKVPDGYVLVQMHQNFPWMPKGEGDSSGLVSMPLIIPPVREKTYDFFGDLFSNIWQQAQDAIEACDEIVVIGYSFPRTDLRSHALFVQAFLRRKSIPRVYIIDPSPKRVADKFKLDYGIPASHLRVLDEPFIGARSLSKLSLLNSQRESA